MMGVIASTTLPSGLINSSLSTLGAPDNDRCNSTFTGSTVYIDSSWNDPVSGYAIGDVVYTANSKTTTFDGQDLWWRIFNNDENSAWVGSYKIDSSGVIQDTNSCS